MKLRLCALLLALCLALAGCSSMLERESASVQPHGQSIATADDPSSLQAKNYQELVSAVLFMVTHHAEEGTVKLYNYTGDVEADLSAACLEVVQKDPLGAYAVDYIKHNLNRIVSYYEASVDISYRRTAEEVGRVVSVTGSSAIKNELREALSEFSNHITLRVSYFGEDEDYIRNLVAQAYYSAPEAAFGMPEVAMSLYPDSGIQRIVDIELTYPADLETLLNMRLELEARLDELMPVEERFTAEQAYSLLTSTARLTDNPEHHTAYSALVKGRATAEGLALAYQLLCDRAGLSCTVVRGNGDSPTPFWNIVTTPSGSRHVDCSVPDRFGLTDLQLNELGEYQWDDSYPLCRDSAEMQISP